MAGWLEAFGAHPRIGDAATLKAKLGGFADMSRHEQAAAADAPDEVFQVRSHYLPCTCFTEFALIVSATTLDVVRSVDVNVFSSNLQSPVAAADGECPVPFCLPPLLP